MKTRRWIAFWTIALALWASLAAAQGEPQPKFESIAAVTPQREGEDVYLQGRIVSHRTPWNARAPHLVTITDGSGEIDVVFWDLTYERLAEKEKYQPGATLQAFVNVGIHRGKVQGVLKDAAHMRVVSAGSGQAMPAPAAGGAPAASSASAGEGERMKVADLTPASLGKLVKLHGRAAQVRAPKAGTRAPYVVSLDDTTGSVDVVFWQDFHEGLAADQRPVEGTQYEVVGEVKDFRGRLQVQPRKQADFRVAGSAPAMAAALSGGMASGDPFGEDDPFSDEAFAAAGSSPFGGSGQVASASPFSPSGSTGGASPFAGGGASPFGAPGGATASPFAPPANGAAASPFGAPGGATPSPFGAPTNGGTKSAMSQPPVDANAPVTPINEITIAHEGERRTITGTVERALASSYGLLLTVRDRSKEIKVYIARDVVNEMPQARQIEKGWRVKIRGTVRLYKSEPELHPSSAADVLEAIP